MVLGTAAFELSPGSPSFVNQVGLRWGLLNGLFLRVCSLAAQHPFPTSPPLGR